AITPGAGFVNGYGAIVIGVVASTLVWMAIRFLSRAPMFRHVDDTLGVIYTHGVAGLVGGLMVGIVLDPHMVVYLGAGGGATDLPGLSSVAPGQWTPPRWQAATAGRPIAHPAVMSLITPQLTGLLLPLRPSDPR